MPCELRGLSAVFLEIDAMTRKTWALLAVLFYASAPARANEMTVERHKTELDKLMATMQQVIGEGPYKPTEESLNRYPTPEWYADAKFGIFVHYGLFSVPGYSGVGCWYGNNMYDPKSGAYAFHREQFGPQDNFGYKDFAPYLTANRFDADEWIGLFKEAGARFVVPVSCFHDGFAMWNSKLTDWSVVKKGPKCDYDGLLAVAARKQGLKFGVAWHAFFRPDFFRSGRRPGTDVQPPNAGTPWSIYGPGGIPLSREFIDDSLGRLVELVDGYQPDLVWFDFDTAYVPPHDLRRFMTFYVNRAVQWKKGVAINDKHENLFPRSIVLDFERGKTSGLRSDLWQTDTSVSWRDWSYMRNDSFKTVDELIRELVDIVSKNGVLLLDVGPRPDGAIPPEPQAILRGIGAWLKVNGEAIYGTRPCWALGFGEGPHNSGGAGFSDRQVDYTHRDFRFTQKGNILYAVAMDWPEVSDHFLITSLSERSTLATGGITSVSLLGAEAPLDWKLTPEGLWIRRPEVRPCDAAYVFKIELHGVCVERLAAQRIDKKQIRVELRLRNLDVQPVRQKIAIADNGRRAGTMSLALKPLETVSRLFVLDAAQTEAVETVTASAPGSQPFPAHAELLNPPSEVAARRFDGQTKLAVSGLGKQGKLTISLWARVDALHESFAALLNTAGWAPGGMHLQYLQNGILELALQGPKDGGNCHSNSAPGKAGGWQMITVTYDAAARRAELYVNGKLDIQMTAADSFPVNLNAFTLGGWTEGERRFHGRMADVRIYGRVLSPSEIQALLHGRPNKDALLAAWDFAQTDGNVVHDSSGQGHDAEVVQ
jgi:alpha-L-fucosidase